MKKKRVRYIAAATAGLVPTALGVAYPTAAQASSGCTGKTEFWLPNNGYTQGHGWYTNSGNFVCIGTMYVGVWTSYTGYDFPYVAVTAKYSASRYYGSEAIWADAGTYGWGEWGIHKWFHKATDGTIAVDGGSTYMLSKQTIKYLS